MNKKGNIPENLTFDEFKKFAEREPVLTGNWYYEVVQSFFDPSMKVPYPMFDLDYPEKRIFASFEDVLYFLQSHKEDYLYCTWVIQHPFEMQTHEHGACWLFGPDNELLDLTTTHSFGEGMDALFLGRPKNRKRFQKGDIVEVVYEDSVRLAVLCDEGPSIDWCWEYYQRCKKTPAFPYMLDSSDESVVVIDGSSFCYHQHLSPLNIMKPRFPIPKDIEDDMRTWLRRAESETPEDMDNGGKDYQSYSVPENLNCEYSDLVGIASKLNLYLQFAPKDDVAVLILSDDFGFKASLRTDSARYADYPGYSDRLSESQLKSLQQYLKEEEQGKTKWWYMIRDWNESAVNRQINPDLPLPDYTSLI